MIDLHSHTLHSDGQRTPAELLAEAAAAGVAVLSVTDHDTVSGLAEAARAASERGVRLVPGIELSAELHGREVHVLGHFIDSADPAMVVVPHFFNHQTHHRAQVQTLLSQLGRDPPVLDLHRVLRPNPAK